LYLDSDSEQIGISLILPDMDYVMTVWSDCHHVLNGVFSFIFQIVNVMDMKSRAPVSIRTLQEANVAIPSIQVELPNGP
jgi:hypothetical protein